jgi:hypothetical protein
MAVVNAHLPLLTPRIRLRSPFRISPSLSGTQLLPTASLRKL